MIRAQRVHDRSRTARPHADSAHAVRLSERTFRRLEELKSRNPKGSVAEVIDAAIRAYPHVLASAELADYEHLTPRLREVLRMVAQGISTREIAGKLKVTTRTVEFHRAKLLRRLRIHGTAALVHYAIRVGAVRP